MSRMKEIIEAAVRGGWRNSLLRSVVYKEDRGIITFKYADQEWDGTTKWTETIPLEKALMESVFWKALGKECGWKTDEFDWFYGPKHVQIALKFHQKNLTEGLSSAIEWLSALTGKE